jgi:hypothetical protein
MKLIFVSLICAWLLMGGYYSGNGTVTTAGTAVQLSVASSPIPPTSCITLTIQAKSSNSGTLYIGGSNVSAANKIGAALTNGVTPPASAYFGPSSTTALYSPQTIWLDTTNSGDGYTYTCYK